MTDKPITELPHEPSCECCDETQGLMYLHARCHMSSPLEVALEGNGILVINCFECKAPVGRFRVMLDG